MQPEPIKRKQVRIDDPHSPYHGQIGELMMRYYDINHTGSSPDLYFLTMPHGGALRVLSTHATILDEMHAAPTEQSAS